MNTSGWQNARKRVGIPNLRIHDLRHTCGHRLRSAGVSYEDRQDLLGHKSDRITTHYSSAELSNLISAANLIVHPKVSVASLTVVKEGVNVKSRKTPAKEDVESLLDGKAYVAT